MDDTAEHLQANAGPKGIGGWLILQAIGIVLGPFAQTWYAFKLILIFVGDAWPVLTNPDSPNYNSFWKPALIYEFAGHIFFACYSIAVAILFFSHSRHFPKLIIVLFILYAGFAIGDLLFCRQIPFIAQNETLMQKEYLAIIRSIAVCAIWIPYYCVSERVKNTFIE